MLSPEVPLSNQNHTQMGFELAGVSWSEFAAGTLQAHFGHNWADFGPFEGISSEGLIRLKVP
jgi:hypothetical protein